MADRTSPFKGLRPFDDVETDVEFFFGRDVDREIIVANLMASRLTVLYGETGVGKSSVLRAGVAHHLRASSRSAARDSDRAVVAVVVFDSWQDDPVRALSDTVAAGVRDTLGRNIDLPIATDSLAHRLEAWTELLGGDLYVILDQAEEFFLYHDADEAGEEFIEQLADAVRLPSLRASFVLSLREDSVAKLDRFRRRIPNVLGNYLRLDYLDRESGRAAIVGPVGRYNELLADGPAVDIEPDLVEAVLDQVTAGRVELGRVGRGTVGESDDGDGRIETPFLQLVMQRLWEHDVGGGSPTLRLSTLEELGGAQQIVRDHLDRALASLSPRQRDVAALVFNHLVTPSGTKIAHAVPDLARYADVEEGELQPMLSTLARERILRPVAAEDGSARYEIYHDVLGDAVLAWRAAHETERELEQQRRAADRRHRRLLAVIGVGAVLLAAMAGVTVFALTQRSEARAQARLAAAGELAAEAGSELDVDPQRALGLAVESARMKHTPEGEEVLREALLAPQERAILPSAGPVRAASFSPNGRFVISASDDATARIWSVSTGRTVRVLHPGGRVCCASYSRDGRLLLTGGSNGVAAIWSASTGDRLHVLPHPAPLTAAFFSSDGTLVVTASRDGTIRLWRPETGALVRSIRVGEPVDEVVLSPNDRLLVAMGRDRSSRRHKARIYNATTGRLLRELWMWGITTAAFSPDSRLLATGGLDHRAATWNVRTGKRLRTLVDPDQGAITSVSFGPNSKLVATTSTDGTTRVWRAAGGTRAFVLLGHTLPVVSGSWSRSGAWLVTTSLDGTARVWKVSTGRGRAVLRGHLDTVFGASFNQSRTAIVTASKDGTARIWNAGTAPALRLFVKGRQPLTNASWSPDGRLIAIAGEDGNVRILDGRGRAMRVLREKKPIAGVEFSADGSLLVSAGGHVVHVRRANDGATLQTIRQSSLVEALSTSGDARLLATGGNDGRIRIWTVHGGLVKTLRQKSGVTAISFSPDARLLITAGEDGLGRIWDVRTGAINRTLRGHHKEITSAFFSPTGRRAITVSLDHDMRIWDVRTGNTIRLAHAHFGPVFGASISSDGRWIVTAGQTTAGLWDGLTGRLLVYLRGHDDALTDATFSPDGQRILTVSRDGSARVYDCVPCRGIGGLLAVAEARLARIARPLTPAARDRYLPG